MRWGIDIVAHSATKILGGHHDLTAGAICCSKELAEKIWRMHITLGSVLSPMDAWLLRGCARWPCASSASTPMRSRWRALARSRRSSACTTLA